MASVHTGAGGPSQAYGAASALDISRGSRYMKRSAISLPDAMTRRSTLTICLSRVLRVVAAWLLVVGYCAVQTGLVDMMTAGSEADGCCPDEGERDCPPACGHCLRCGGIAHVPATRTEFPADLPLWHLAKVWMPPGSPPADANSLRVFRPPRARA